MKSVNNPRKKNALSRMVFDFDERAYSDFALENFGTYGPGKCQNHKSEMGKTALKYPCMAGEIMR